MATLCGRAVRLERGDHGGVGLAQQRLELFGDRRLRHAARSITAAASAATRVAGAVVGPPRLRLEAQEDRGESAGALEDQPAVLPDAVVVAELARVALVLVDVVDAATVLEGEERVARVVRAPGLAEDVDPRAAAEHQVEELVEVVVRARPWRAAAGGTGSGAQSLAADVVEPVARASADASPR